MKRTRKPYLDLVSGDRLKVSQPAGMHCLLIGTSILVTTAAQFAEERGPYSVPYDSVDQVRGDHMIIM